VAMLLEAQHSRSSDPDLSISIVKSLHFLASDRIPWVGKTFGRLIERTQSASAEQSAEYTVVEESEPSCALPG
jgi:hypothetical protein